MILHYRMYKEIEIDYIEYHITCDKQTKAVFQTSWETKFSDKYQNHKD